MQNAYDELGRAKGSTYVIGDATQTYGITYENITGLVKNYTTPGNSFTYTYDAFDRLTQKLGTRHAIAYTYVAGSQRVATYNFSQADATNITYSYTYDALGNITQIKKNGTTVSNYEYDSLGRLIREDDCTNSISWVYTYDNAGNLLKKYTFYGMTGIPASHLLSLHPYNGSEISSTYTYSSSAWGDLLTGYNGTEIEYDAIGNPLNWHNAASMLWDGRKLTYFSEDALDHGIAFAYNSDGIRTKKTLYDYDGPTITHNYILDGSTILKETITSGSGTSTLYYYYDESGVSGLEYNGTKYSYVKNLQGDVIRIINANGVTVVEYNYDAWGNILSTTGSMASTLGAANPFRYRGYYYDAESGWYYLNSRYYDPQVGRFLNADGIVGANGDITGYNMFAYCNNNPVKNEDRNGYILTYSLGPDIIGPWHMLIDVMSRQSSGGGMGTNGQGGLGTTPSDFVKTSELIDETSNKLLDSQNYDYDYGYGNIKDQGCGVVAVHNAKVMLGIPSSLPETAHDMEDLGILLMGGLLGTNPWGIAIALDYYDIDYSTVSLDRMTKPGVYIVSYFHKNPFNGAHNVAVIYNGETYDSYNVNATPGCHPREYTGVILAIYYLGVPNQGED